MWLTFLAILAIVVVDSLIFGKVAQDCPAQSAAHWAKLSASRPRFPMRRFSPRYWVNNVPGPHIDFCVDCEQSKHARKKKSELEKLIFCKASVFFKLLRKTMFQVPRPTHKWILGGMEAVQTCAKKTIFRSLKNCFSATPNFIP